MSCISYRFDLLSQYDSSFMLLLSKRKEMQQYMKSPGNKSIASVYSKLSVKLESKLR